MTKCLNTSAVLGISVCYMYFMIAPVVSVDAASSEAPAINVLFPPSLTSPIIFKGGPKVAYRDPAAVYVDRDPAAEISEDLKQTSFFRCVLSREQTSQECVSQGNETFKGNCQRRGQQWDCLDTHLVYVPLLLLHSVELTDAVRFSAGVFELWHSLVGTHQSSWFTNKTRSYTFDIYTALVHTIEKYWDLDSNGKRRDEQRQAVGLTDGVAPSEEHPYWQTSRQQHFPLVLTDIGISFDCMNGQASIPMDEQRIKQAIEGEGELLNETVHGAVAAAVLSHVLKDDNRARQYLEATKEGQPMREVSVQGDVANETLVMLVDSLDDSVCRNLHVNNNNRLTLLPANVGRLPKGSQY